MEEVRIIMCDSAEVARQQAEAAQIRFLSEFREDLANFNMPVRHGDRQLQPYLSSLLRQGSFEFRSPFSELTASSLSATFVHGDVTFFEFHDVETYYLISRNLSLGYPLAALYIPGKSIVLKFDDPVWGVQQSHIDEFNRAAQRRAKGNDSQMVITGNPNFAHVLWNQLPAIRRLIEEQAEFGFATPSIAVSHEPLGKIDEIFPELKNWNVIRSTPSMFADPTLNHVATFTIGSTFCRGDLRAKVLGYCEIRLGDDARSYASTFKSYDGSIFWISVRTANRTIVDQAAILSLLVCELLKKFPHCIVFLDGHSVPMDIHVAGRYNVLATEETVQRDRSVADEIIAAASAQGLVDGNHKIINGAGLNICESLTLAKYATCYFCHHGTVQHKVGWMAGVPGIVHANRGVLEKSPSLWAASMVEGASTPEYLTPDEVIDSGFDDYNPTGLSQQLRAVLNHQDYSFIDSSALVAKVIDRFSTWSGKSMSEKIGTHSSQRLNTIIEAVQATSYLEIGVEKGLTFFDVNASRKVAIDPAFRFDHSEKVTESQSFFKIPSDEYFSQGLSKGLKFDVAFLDGLHTFEQTLRDFLNVLACVNDKFVIVIDDVFPTDVFSARRDHPDAIRFRKMHGLEGTGWHGDVFKTVFFIHDFMPMLSFFTFRGPYNCQTVVLPKSRADFKPMFNSLEAIERLTYFEMMDRQQVLNFTSDAEIFAQVSLMAGTA